MKHSVAQIGAIVTASSLLWVTPNEDLDNTIFNEVKSPLHSAAQRKQISISELNSKPEELPRFGGSAETLRERGADKNDGREHQPLSTCIHSIIAWSILRGLLETLLWTIQQYEYVRSITADLRLFS